MPKETQPSSSSFIHPADAVTAATASEKGSTDTVTAATASEEGPARKRKAAAEAHPAVKFQVPGYKTAGLKLQHAVEVGLQLLTGKLAVYKIGVAFDPVHRFSNAKYGYQHAHWGGFAEMRVVAKGRSQEMAMLEASLILHFRTIRPEGMQNTGPGGEGLRNDGPDVTFYCYIVVKYLPRLPPS